ncbi:MAG: TIGR02453 family protein [Gallionellales bacterium GWA2_60_142]|nr:MAG: TIGR02453 family protein [Gallionellales bacterium GWA2_60_142]HCI13871.1 TIGR02453 family protein [Gallionellaceae bacterium]
MTDRYFTRQTFAFLEALADNNSREWFEEHKQEYEDFVRTPALDFIADMSDEMPAISRHFLAQPKKVGGSLMRVQRDTRFSRDKTPYKVNIGIQFRHEVGKDVHAPGYYLHIEPGGCFLGIGLWRPEADALFKIRSAIVEHPDAWVAARDDKDFREHFTLEGDSLVNAPRGFAKDNPLVEDLKRKDFIGMAALSTAEVTSKKLRTLVVERFRQAAPYMEFLCKALDLRF